MSRTLLVTPGRHGAYNTVGEALRDAPDGGVVTIADGTYAETFEPANRRLTLRAADSATVVLDGHRRRVARARRADPARHRGARPPRRRCGPTAWI